MKRVLLIDDDRKLRSLIAEFLRGCGWQTFEAGDGETGLDLALQHRPTAVVCDLLLPRSNGFQVCTALRKQLGPGGTKIIAISGRGYASNRQMALQAGADEFLQKPINPRDLNAALGEITQEQDDNSDTLSPPASESHPPTLVKFWGVRGSVPVPGPTTLEYGGNTSCIEIRAENELIVLDCGTGARPLGQHLASEFKDEPLDLTILISHTHWDHIQGFPFFLPAYEPKNRIQVLGYEGAREGFVSVFSAQMDNPYFPIGLRELPGNVFVTELKDHDFQIGPVRVQAAFMNHPGICMGYRLQTSGGSIAYLPDNEPFDQGGALTRHQVSHKTEVFAYAKAEDRKMVEFVRQADLLIIDAQYDSEEYKSHVGWGHGCLDEVVRLALRAEVKRLVLFHHDPSHDDQKVTEMVEHARKMVSASQSDLIVEAAREGLQIALAPDAQATGADRSRPKNLSAV